MHQKNSPNAHASSGNHPTHPNRRSTDSLNETFAEIFNDPNLSHDEKLQRYAALWVGVEEIHLDDAEPLPDFAADAKKRTDDSMSTIQSRMADLMPYEYDVIEISNLQEKDVVHLFFEKTFRDGKEDENVTKVHIELFLCIDQVRGDHVIGQAVFATDEGRYGARARIAFPIFVQWRRKLDIRFMQTGACDAIPTPVSVLLHEYYMKRCIVHQQQSFRAKQGIVGLIKSIIRI